MDPLLRTFKGDGAKLTGIDARSATCASGLQECFLFPNSDHPVGTRRHTEFAPLALFFMNNNRHKPSFSYTLYRLEKTGHRQGTVIFVESFRLSQASELKPEQGLFQKVIQDIPRDLH